MPRYVGRGGKRGYYPEEKIIPTTKERALEIFKELEKDSELLSELNFLFRKKKIEQIKKQIK